MELRLLQQHNCLDLLVMHDGSYWVCALTGSFAIISAPDICCCCCCCWLFITIIPSLTVNVPLDVCLLFPLFLISYSLIHNKLGLSLCMSLISSIHVWHVISLACVVFFFSQWLYVFIVKWLSLLLKLVCPESIGVTLFIHIILITAALFFHL